MQTKELQNKTSKVFLIVGPAGAGKSTIAKLLTKTFKQCALIEVDVIRHMIISGHISPFKKTISSELQLELAIKNTCALTKNFTSEGFNVVIDDVVSTKSKLDLYLKLLPKKSLYVFLLMPDKKTLRTRDLSRSKHAQMKQRALNLHGTFLERIKTEDRWHIIDNSKLTKNQTLTIIKNTSNANKRITK